MPLPREDCPKRIADQLNVLAAQVKTRSLASFTDATRILETIAKRFFNALFGWDLVNLNIEHPNYPAADLGDRKRRIAIQITNQEGSDKISHTADKAIEHKLGEHFDRLIVFFLLPKKPGLPKKFAQPPGGPEIETSDIADLLKQMQEMDDLDALTEAAKVLDEEMGKVSPPETEPKFDISRILKYAPAELIGRSDETKLLKDAWKKAVDGKQKRPHVLTFVALGGEGKTALVAKWAVDEMLARGWLGCETAFAWSFYSQGTRNQAASSDTFLKEALIFFGDTEDKAFAASPAGAFEKGQRLARVVGQRRNLLILDGIEPLQYSPTSPTPGELKDQGLAALLKGLATTNRGLCIVTTRYSLPNLRAFWQSTGPEVRLLRLSREAGVYLLQTLGVKGSLLVKIPFNDGKEELNEYEKLVEDVKGHALTLTLFGRFLKRAFHGDIRQRDRVKFEKADEKIDGGHAFRVMAAYEQWLLRDGGDEGQREVAVLRLMGLFDRPAASDCLAVLRSGSILGLTEPLGKLTDDDWEFCLSGLEATKLVTINYDASGTLISVDTHPLLREYFSRQLREQRPDAWRAAHQRLYEHLIAATNEGDQPTLEDIQMLYQAVAHGCQAGWHQHAWEKVYIERINRGNDQFYSLKKLGAFGSDLGAVVCFFELPWSRLAKTLSSGARASLLGTAAFELRAVGRLTESAEPMQASLQLGVSLSAWDFAAKAASNLSELELTLGDVAEAVRHAEESVTYADRSGDAGQRRISRSTYAGALHQAGRRSQAHMRFSEVEQMQQEYQPGFPLLYSLSGFQYCDLLLADTERVAWQVSQKLQVTSDKSELLKACRTVSHRAAQTLRWAEQHLGLLNVALDDLTLGRAAFYEAILSQSEIQYPKSEIEQAVSTLRRAGTQHMIPHGLLTRAWLRFLERDIDGAEADLEEAWEIAERGPMRLFTADIHLHRARLFLRVKPYPWNENPDGSPRGAKDDLDAAEKIILHQTTCREPDGEVITARYARRDEELADAKEAARAAGEIP